MNRRTWSRWLSIACVWMLAVLPASLGLSRDWLSGRADSQGTGATEESLPKELDLLWEVKLEGLGFDAGPIIANGVVYANDHDGRIVAIDLKSGDEIWRKELDTGFVATPSYRNGKLYAADYDGRLRAIDAKSGEELWGIDSGGEITGSPVFYKDSVVFTSQSGALYRLNAEDGTQEWKYETGEPILCGASLAGDITFLGGCDEYLHVVDLETGKRIGEPVQIGATQSTPAVSGKSVLIPVHAGIIFKFAVTKDRKLDLEWQVQGDDIPDDFRNSLAVKDGLAIGTGRNKRVFAVKVDDGEVLWTSRLRKRADASPIIAGDSVFIAAADGRIVRLDLKTGDETWMFELKPSFIASPAAADGKLVVANDRGTIFCFGEKNGK